MGAIALEQHSNELLLSTNQAQLLPPECFKAKLPALVQGPSDPPIRETTIGAFLRDASVLDGDGRALAVPWQHYEASYRDLEERSALLARALISSGVYPGQHVGIMAGNRFEFIDIFLGAARIGCPVVCLNITYTPAELELALVHSDCSRLFIASKIGSRDMSEHVKVAQQVQSSSVACLEAVVVIGDNGCTDDNRIVSYARFTQGVFAVSEAELQAFEQLQHPADGVMIQFTSGTTGTPKCSVLTHRGILTNARYVGDAMRLTTDDVVLCPPPLFHTFGIVVGFLAAFSRHCPIVFPCDTFHADSVIDVLTEQCATVLLGVPTMFLAELEVIRRRQLTIRHLRTGIIGGSPTSRPLMERIAQEMQLPGLLVAYGTTETSPLSFLSSLDDPVHNRYTTVGRVLPNTMAKVVDADGRILNRGERGELCIAGYCLHLGYHRNVKATQASLRRDEHGVMWMHSGDEASIDDKGYCRITGRLKDIIIRGGENIYPVEVEECLVQHPAIVDASVVGIKDDHYGEVVGAFLRGHVSRGRIPNAGRPCDKDVQTWVKTSLGRHKVPVHIFWLGDGIIGNDYPKTGSGKVKKHVLSELAKGLIS